MKLKLSERLTQAAQDIIRFVFLLDDNVKSEMIIGPFKDVRARLNPSS